MKDWTINDFPFTGWGLPVDIEYHGKWVHNWFSNMAPIGFTYNNIIFTSGENWYQAHKTTSPINFVQFLNITPSQAKQLGRRVEIRPDWEDIKFDIMFQGLILKCEQNPEFLKQIKNSPNEFVEWNNWNDQIWGASIFDGLGRNALGIQLTWIKNNF